MSSPPVDSVVDMAVPTESLRADARRNRERIITAASELFAAEGNDTLVADVARRAGVGNATVFRHFPTKLDLVVAVVQLRMTGLLAEVERAAAMEDPRQGLEHFVREACRIHVQDHGLKQMAAQHFEGDPVLCDLRDKMMATIDGLVVRGKAAGTVREDAEPIDVLLLIGGIADAASELESLRPGLYRRYAALVVAALRPDDGGPRLEPAPPTTAELEAVWKRRLDKKCGA